MTSSRTSGRFVVGIGVAGSTSTSLAAACDEFEDYDSLPGIDRATAAAAAERPSPSGSTRARSRTRCAGWTLPSTEKPLGFRSFTDFLASHADLVELQEDGPHRLIRLRPEADPQG
ncbi:hypothetical protein [Arthrobacter koreensis]|uniref:hypothetical protein n=1 Tax=Arthrobacter koreensis TaxID=199136 RepID=UPI002DB98A88|nr:hypothetical protein [Arthrobacter koreensis]